ncbi:MAG: LVIVD repeat-containing protein [Actinomycetota bacterium]
MTRTATRLLLALSLLGTVALAQSGPASARLAGPLEGAELTLLQTFEYTGGTDLAFRGKYVYAGVLGGAGGVVILEIVGGVPKKVGFIPCPGSQNDVAVVKPGLLALGFHGGGCAGLMYGGIRLIDVKDPAHPRMLGTVQIPGGTHTLTAYPGEPIIYSNAGGLGGPETIIDVSNPKAPEVVGEYVTNPAGCHDVTFHKTASGGILGFCPGLGGTEIWDASNPLSPDLLSFIPGHMNFPHQAVVSPDGGLLLVTDEAFVAHECVSGHGPLGAIWAYDITVPQAPVPMGQISSPRGSSPAAAIVTAWCTAHNLNFIPDTRLAVVAWYTGGTRVIDFSNPRLPTEVAYFRPPDGNVWSSYYFKGLIYANDLNRGLDVLKLES